MQNYFAPARNAWYHIHLMNGAHRNLSICIVLLCSWIGCATPPPAATSAKQDVPDEEQVRSLLGRFEEGVRNDDIDLIMSLYSPSLTTEERRKERERAQHAMRSFRYSDYDLFEQVELPPDALRSGRLKLKFEFTKPNGKVGDDKFSLRREDGRWYMVSVGLETPDKGDHADLRADEREQILRTIADCNQAILSGDMDTLIADLSPQMSATERAKITENVVDLLKLHKYQYFSSTFSRSALEVEFGTNGELGVPLDFMYVRHDGRRGERKLRFCFGRFDDTWHLVDIDRRDSKFWKSFAKIAIPLAVQASRFAR